MQCKPVFEGQLVIKDYPKFLADLVGIIVDDPSRMVKLCCNVGMAGKTRNPVFARLSCTTFGTLIQKSSNKDVQYYGYGQKVLWHTVYESNVGK